MKRTYLNIDEVSTVAILNGTPGLHETDSDCCKIFEKSNKTVHILDDLFKDHEKLKRLEEIRPDTIVVGTTNLSRKHVKLLIEYFIALCLCYGYEPKRVIFTHGGEYFIDAAEALNCKMYKTNINTRTGESEKSFYEYKYFY